MNRKENHKVLFFLILSGLLFLFFLHSVGYRQRPSVMTSCNYTSGPTRSRMLKSINKPTCQNFCRIDITKTIYAHNKFDSKSWTKLDSISSYDPSCFCPISSLRTRFQFEAVSFTPSQQPFGRGLKVHVGPTKKSIKCSWITK